MNVARVAMVALFLCPLFARAAGSDYAPILEAGMHSYSGVQKSSLNGSTGYFMTFRAEKRKGFARPSIAAELQSASGEASIGAYTPSYSMTGAVFLPGTHFFLFPSGRFMPYVGVSVIIGWARMNLGTDPPGSLEPYTQGLSFGYMPGAGVDIRTGRIDGNALRIAMGLYNASAPLAGVSCSMTGFRLSLGVYW